MSDFDDDFDTTARNRYYTDPTSHMVCFNCGKRGHFRENCPEPTPCFLCGSRDHLPQSCIQGNCYNCSRPGHQKQDCPKPKMSSYCKRCGLNDHCVETCPDIWRSFLRSGKQTKRVTRVFCYNCAKEGHFGDDCELSRFGAPQRLSNCSFSSFTQRETLERAGYHGRNLALAPVVKQQVHRSYSEGSSRYQPYSYQSRYNGGYRR